MNIESAPTESLVLGTHDTCTQTQTGENSLNRFLNDVNYKMTTSRTRSRVQPGDTGAVMHSHLVFDPGGGEELSLGQDKCQIMVLVTTINQTRTHIQAALHTGVVEPTGTSNPSGFEASQTFLVDVTSSFSPQ